MTRKYSRTRKHGGRRNSTRRSGGGGFFNWLMGTTTSIDPKAAANQKAMMNTVQNFMPVNGKPNASGHIKLSNKGTQKVGEMGRNIINTFFKPTANGKLEFIEPKSNNNVKKKMVNMATKMGFKPVAGPGNSSNNPMIQPAHLTGPLLQFGQSGGPIFGNRPGEANMKAAAAKMMAMGAK